MSENQLPPQVQEQLVRLQQMQQTLQAIVTQKQQLDIELAETDRAISELEKIVDDVPVFKTVGSLMLKADRQTLLTELNEKKELLNTRVTVLGKQEERTREKVKETQKKIQERLKPASNP